MREIIIDKETAQLFKKIATSDKIDTQELFKSAQRDPNEFRKFLTRMDLDKHPDATAILQSLKRGDILTLSSDRSENTQQKREARSEARRDYGMHGAGYEDRDTYESGPRLMGADTLIGDDVYNHNEEDLGDIKEIMLDVNDGRIAYAVLSFGGFLGMANKLFAVPWSALKLDPANKRFLLNVEKERLESAPGFDKDNWPDMMDKTWQSAIHSFYGTTPYSNKYRNYPRKNYAGNNIIPASPDTNTQSDSIGDWKPSHKKY